jgi:hypothetical protein
VSVSVFLAIDDCNQVIDYLIESRRTVRRFTSELFPENRLRELSKLVCLHLIRELAFHEGDFRRFAVIPRGSHLLPQIATLLKRGAGGRSNIKTLVTLRVCGSLKSI